MCKRRTSKEADRKRGGEELECFSHDIGPVVRMARPENSNEIDEYVNPFCTELDEIGSFQSYCIGHFEHEWLDALGQMIAER